MFELVTEVTCGKDPRIHSHVFLSLSFFLQWQQVTIRLPSGQTSPQAVSTKQTSMFSTTDKAPGRAVTHQRTRFTERERQKASHNNHSAIHHLTSFNTHDNDLNKEHSWVLNDDNVNKWESFASIFWPITRDCVGYKTERNDRS